MTTSQTNRHHTVLPYREDIDGLRALSIAGVVLFHAFPGALTGGFIGVDVFFVISGFLISSIILKKIQSDDFSLVDFYCKRIIRIFPALLSVLIAVYAAGWLTLYAQEFALVGKHIAAGASFVQNFVLLSESGYFDTASESKPLMHLWSLAIEEQFYLLYPLLLMIAWRMGGRFSMVIVGALLLSFAGNIHLTQTQANQAFYYPHTRFWELLMGALVCLLLQRQTVIPSSIRQASSVSGLLLIIAGYAFISSGKAFPGWWALIPTVGASLIILAGPNTWTNRCILSHAAMQFMGRISYPLYLWHWPLLVFPAILCGGKLSPELRALLVALSVLLAWATYAWIEHPIRFSGRLRAKSLALLLTSVFIGFVGYNTYHRAGLTFRSVNKLNTAPQTASLRAAQPLTSPECGVAEHERSAFLMCHQDKHKPIRYVVWGDSKGEALYWGLTQKQNTHYGWRMVGDIACAPMKGAQRNTPDAENDPSRCARANPIALRSIISNPEVKVVLIGTAFRVLTRHNYIEATGKLTSEQAAWQGLSAALSELEAAGKKIIFAIDNPTLPDPSQCMPPRQTDFALLNRLLDRPLPDACTISYAQHLNETRAYRRHVAELQARHPNMLVYSPDHLLCDLSQGTCPVLKNGRFLYSYTDHLSDYGSGLIADEIMSLVESDNPTAGAP